jgi:CRP/FNR family transcriptional regulator, cyclic AMP receptor protein
MQPFSALDDDSIAQLVNASRMVVLPKGRLLFSQNEEADAVYVVCAGVVALVLSTIDGRELVIDELQAGSMFGELSVLTDKRRSTSAVAHDTCEVLAIPVDVFQHALETMPALMRQVLAMTAQRLRECSARESALAFLDAPGRLARTLLLLNQESSGNGVIITSQEEIAQRVGLTRQTVAKELGQWRRAGWLQTGRGKIVLLDLPALRRQAAALDA